MLIFVYGTLKAGHGNHRILQDGGAEFLGVAEAPGIVYGPFPYAKPSDSTDDWIKGELYKVSQRLLEQLDRLEGHPHFYERTPIALRNGQRAEIYYYSGKITGASTPCEDNEWNGIRWGEEEERVSG